MATDNYNVEIEPVRGHGEVRIDGEFFCSADSRGEAEREIYDI